MQFFGAEGGIWTHMVSRTILSRVRLPFRHFGLYLIVIYYFERAPTLFEIKELPFRHFGLYLIVNNITCLNDFIIISQKKYFGNNYYLIYSQLFY